MAQTNDTQKKSTITRELTLDLSCLIYGQGLPSNLQDHEQKLIADTITETLERLEVIDQLALEAEQAPLAA